MSAPISEVASPTELMVVNTWSSDCVFYDLESLEETKRFEIVSQPHEARYDTKRDVVYVSVPYRDGYYDDHQEKAHDLAIVDPKRREVVDVIDLSPNVGPHALCIDTDRDMLWMSVETDGGAVIGLDLDSHEVKAQIPTGKGDGKPHWMEMTGDGSKMYTANKESRFVSVVDLVNGELTKQIPVSGGSEDIVLSTDGTQMFVSSREDPVLHLIDIASDEEVKRIELDDVPGRLGMTADGRLIVTHYHFPYQLEGRIEPGRVSIVDPETHEQTVATTVDEGPVDMISSNDGSTAYVSNARSGTLLEIDLNDGLEIKRRVKTGNAPHGVLLV